MKMLSSLAREVLDFELEEFGLEVMPTLEGILNNRTLEGDGMAALLPENSALAPAMASFKTEMAPVSEIKVKPTKQNKLVM